MVVKNINPANNLIFDLKVVEACKSCKRYGLTGSCPPQIGNIEYYQKFLKSYKNGKIYIEKFLVTDSDKWRELGRKSSLFINSTLLRERQKLFDKGHYFSIIFGAGSCKKCKKCSIPCKTPQFRVIPIEATGIDVVATLYKLGMLIKFPIKSYFYRIGIILYD